MNAKLEDSDERQEVVDDLVEIKGVESVKYYEGNDPYIEVQTRSASVPTPIMQVLSDSGLSLEPVEPGKFRAHEEREGFSIMFPPEIWGEMIRQYECFDSLLDNPAELAKVAQAAVENDRCDDETFEEVVTSIEEARDLWECFVSKMDEDLKDVLRDFELDAEDLDDSIDDARIEKVPGGPSELIISNAEEVNRAMMDDPFHLKPSDLPGEDTDKRKVLEALAREAPATAEEMIESLDLGSVRGHISTLKTRDNLVECVGRVPKEGVRNGGVEIYEVTEEAKRILKEEGVDVS